VFYCEPNAQLVQAATINLKSQGVIPVAILTTDTFDATTVNAATIRFGKTGTEAAIVRSALEDVDGDGAALVTTSFTLVGVNSTLPGIHQLDKPPGPHRAADEALDARESRYANPKGYMDSTRSASFPTDVNNVLTRFGWGHGPAPRFQHARHGHSVWRYLRLAHRRDL